MALAQDLRASREAVHLLRPADRDGDPAGPVPRLGIVGHVDDREAAEVLLGLDERPIGEDGRAAARVDAAHDGRRVQAAVAEDEDTAAFISSITALPALPRSRTSSIVRSGTHSSLKAIRYCGISSSSAHGQPGWLPLTFSTNALASIRHPRPRSFQAFRLDIVRTTGTSASLRLREAGASTGGTDRPRAPSASEVAARGDG